MTSTASDEPLPDDALPLAALCKLVPSVRPGRDLHPSTPTRWIHAGRLRGWKGPGGHWLASRAEFLALFRQANVLRAEAAQTLDRRRSVAEAEAVLDAAGVT